MSAEMVDRPKSVFCSLVYFVGDFQLTVASICMQVIMSQRQFPSQFIYRSLYYVRNLQLATAGPIQNFSISVQVAKGRHTIRTHIGET